MDATSRTARGSPRHVVLLALMLLALSSSSSQERQTRSLRQPTSGPDVDYQPVFAPSGDRILFTSRGAYPAAMFLVNVEGGNPERVPVDLTGDLYSDWAPDGKSIVFDAWPDGSSGLVSDGARVASQYDGDLWVVGSSGGTPARLTDFPGREGNPTWSPDGRTIAFGSDRSGHDDLWLLTLASPSSSK